MTDAETNTLYALSTLAQTCAALAAFVGAVGVFRLQNLVQQRAEREHHLRGLVGSAGLFRGETQYQLVESIQASVRCHRDIAESDVYYGRVREALRASDDLDGFAQRIRRGRCWLVIFGGWNLLVIFAALVGFNHVAALATCPWLLWVLWPVAGITVVVTGYCVFVWTQG